jgi:hypothetical protein
LLLLVLAGAIGLAFAYRERLDFAALGPRVAEAGAAAPPLFVCLYALVF